MADWLYLPLDGRPCNSRFPVELAALAGHRLRVPPVELLGSAREQARRDRLQVWLESQAEGARGLLLSLDTWLYGNLVASRKNREPLESLLERSEGLRSFQAKGLEIHGFATLLRLSNSNDATEERPYWAQHGQQIYRLSWLEDYLLSHETDAAARAEYQQLQAAIPVEVLTDYRQLRARNFAVLERLLAAVSEGLLQSLLIGCDDGGSHGWTVQERGRLQARIEADGLTDRVLLYPGADELACSLLARVLEPRRPRLGLAWTYPEARAQLTRYEGLPLEQTLAHQARAAGVELVEVDTEAQALPEGLAGLVWIHNPPGEQIDQFLDRESRVRHSSSRLEPLLQALQRAELPLALADVCYANGGDVQLLTSLEQRQLLFGLTGYAGWNTAGNTLGMLLAWFKLQLLQGCEAQAQRQFLIERLADDGWYQGELRQRLCGHYSEPVTINSCIQAIAFFNSKFYDWLEWMPEPPPALQIKHLSFPWRRFFEVDLKVCFKPSGEDEC